jgi:hypothetical protein
MLRAQPPAMKTAFNRRHLIRGATACGLSLLLPAAPGRRQGGREVALQGGGVNCTPQITY